MSDYLRISATFLDSRFHGRADGGGSEWPPSPLRLMQAIVAANADQLGGEDPLNGGLSWLEQQPPPIILAPRYEQCTAYSLSVPNNAMDLVGKVWARGNYFGGGSSNPAKHRTMKTVRPIRMLDGDTVHFLWTLNQSVPQEFIDSIIDGARRIIALGWGIDLVTGDAERTNSVALSGLLGERWSSTPAAAPSTLRIPITGTLKALMNRHDAFIKRMSENGFVPVPPLATFNMTGYRRPTDPLSPPFVVFELRHDNGEYCRYSQRRLIHIAGMVRHMAKHAMLNSPPPEVDDDWVERYVLGHRPENEENHRQFSYLPLPSIGHEHADQLVRRVMITAPLGDERLLEHLARRLAGQQLRPEQHDHFGETGPPTLVRVQNDNVARAYTRPANRWASVTPVILPGHDDKKPAKTRKLIEKALAQSGIEQPCQFEWSPYSIFRKSFSAHKYDRNKSLQGYFRPSYLENKTALHIRLGFEDDLRVPGPLFIGAGRHCGLGLMASIFGESVPSTASKQGEH
mgnify:CR=1 FL=1